MKHEIFDFASVSQKMNELEELFTRFSNVLEDTSEAIYEATQDSLDATILGDSAASLLELWEDSSIHFPEFKKNFSKWSELVSKISLNNQEVSSEIGTPTSNHLSVQTTKEGGHVVTKVDGETTTTTFYDSLNTPMKVVTESFNKENQCVRTTKTDNMIKTDILNSDGYSVHSSITQTNGGVYKIVHENGYEEFLDQNGKIVDLQNFNDSVLSNKENSFLKKEEHFNR